MKKEIPFLLNSFSFKFGFLNERTKIILKQISLTFIYKGLTIICSFILVPLTINYLTVSNYGIWLTLTSFIGWFSFFDFGLGNGLRNKLAEAKGLGNINAAKAYVSSAYFSLSIISLITIIVFLLIARFINWNYLFNLKSNSTDINTLVSIVFISFSIQLVLNLITTIFISDQKYSISGLIGLVVQISTVIFVWILTKSKYVSLISFGIVISILPIIILSILNFVSFKYYYKSIAPSISLWKKKYASQISKLGMKFFVIQIAGIVLYSTDNFIIAKLFGPEEVTIYNIAFKYFNLSALILGMISAPYWSGITDAYVKKEFTWIDNVLKNLLIISGMFILLLVFMLLFSNSFYMFWIGPGIKIPSLVSVCMAIYFVTVVLTQPFICVINGTGKVKIQYILSIILSIVNIPLSIIFGKYLGLGSAGVILATTICNVPGLILYPIQYKKIKMSY